jgi:hypothetical protein
LLLLLLLLLVVLLALMPRLLNVYQEVGPELQERPLLLYKGQQLLHHGDALLQDLQLVLLQEVLLLVHPCFLEQLIVQYLLDLKCKLTLVHYQLQARVALLHQAMCQTCAGKT